MKCLLVPLLALVFSFAACTKEKNISGELSPIEGAHSRPGLGDNPGLPTGTDWVLPAKISVVARPPITHLIPTSANCTALQILFTLISAL